MKIKFIKDHLENVIGDLEEVTLERANYLIAVNVVIKAKKDIK
jgi:hypothetical protein